MLKILICVSLMLSGCATAVDVTKLDYSGIEVSLWYELDARIQDGKLKPMSVIDAERVQGWVFDFEKDVDECYAAGGITAQKRDDLHRRCNELDQDAEQAEMDIK